LLYGDINDKYGNRTPLREKKLKVAKKYLNPNQRLLLDYVPLQKPHRIKIMMNKTKLLILLFITGIMQAQDLTTESWKSTNCKSKTANLLLWQMV
jgi:hypothetical protein